MGRAPCCDKANVKKGPWYPEEDAKLKSYIEQHGTGGNWIALPQKIGLKRCGKSCRLRWLNYLRPNLKHGGFSEEEDNIICSLYISIGSRWSVIATQLPGRTDNDIKNYWNTRLKKKLFAKHRNNINKEQQQARLGNNNRGSGNYCDSLVSLLVPQNSSSQQLEPHNLPYMMPMLPQIMPPLVPNTNQSLGPCFNDQDSIKKLLVKLGGRFNSNDDYHPTLDGLDLQFSQQNYDQEQVQLGSNSSACINNEGQFAIEEMVPTNLQQRLNGLEFFYGEDTITPNNHHLVASNYQLGDQGVTRQLETHAQDQCDLLQELISYLGEQ